MNILGLDVGHVRIGVALGNTEFRLASPWEVVAAEPEHVAFSRLRELVRQEAVGKVVVGLPRLLRHVEGETEQLRWIRAWTERFRSCVAVPVAFADETLTSKLAARQQQELGGKGKRDDLAAAAILQGYLDAV